MNRTAVFVLAIAFIVSACIPLPFSGQPTAAPVDNSQATDAVLAATMAAETLNALPSPTPVLAVDTPVPTEMVADTPAATVTVVPTETLTPDPNAMTSVTDSTVSATALTGTVVTATVTMTGAVAQLSQVNVTATETLHPRFFGTLPPAVPYGKIRLVNRAKADVYVSLQCKTVDGNTTIIEYPVSGRMNVSAPAGRYNYVAWVGGKQFQGSFGLSRGEELSITFNKDKVTIK